MSAPLMSASLSDAGPIILSQGWRTLVSFLLFLHLFALAVAMLSNTSPQDVERQGNQADLKRQLRHVPLVIPYLRLVNMDLAYGQGNRDQTADYHLTHGSQWDVEHEIELVLKFPNGKVQAVKFPNWRMQPRLRRRHWEMLTAKTARLVGADEVESRLPQAICAHYFNTTGATSAVIRCRAHLLQTIAAVKSKEPAQLDPYSDLYYRTVLEYNAFVAQGTVQLLKVESAADVAPSATPGGNQPAQTSPPPPTSAPAADQSLRLRQPNSASEP